MKLLEGAQMLIQRPRYIKFLKKFQDTEFIKVITGVRRSGKTYLMNMFINELLRKGIHQDQIIHINFENLQYSKLDDYMKLWQYVHDHEVKGKKNYLFFDEIQNVREWERAINSFRIDMDADIYVTGSNSHLLSGELATLLAGRYVELTVFPISFAEFFNFKKVNLSKKMNFLMSIYKQADFLMRSWHLMLISRQLFYKIFLIQ